MNEPSPNQSQLVKELEHVFTIDGRGTPKKCKLFLELLKQYGAEEMIKEISIMSNRKWF